MHADCNAIYFYDPIGKVIGLAHSGWKGTLNEIAKNMVETMVNEFKTEPKNLIVGIGPSICQDCFEVDFDLAHDFLKVDFRYKDLISSTKSKSYIDLWAINRMILTDTGIPDNQIHCMEICTMENLDMLFSHRGHHGKRGLMAAAMMLK